MTDTRQTDEHAHETPDAPPTKLKRRGLIAGAAALAAAVLATRTAQPVGASQLVGTNGGASATDTNADGVQGYANDGNSAGVFGRNNFFNGVGVMGVAPSGIGVSGASTNGPGVSGTSTTYVGVHGNSRDSDGVYGVSTNHFGTSGVSTNVHGIYGTSSNGFGVMGYSASAHGVVGQAVTPGAVGVYGIGSDNIWAGYFTGPIYQSVGNNHGIQGNSDSLYGIVGRSSGSGAAGVFGQSTGTNGTGVIGVAYSPATGAGSFIGDVYISGHLNVAGGKSAVVPHPDGTHRTLYCIEAPESWFEDVGQTNLVAGKATVTLDPDFAVAVLTVNYHVFLTPYGDCKGLYVTAKSATGFTVQEMQGGTSTLSLSWRVMAKRKDITGARLAKFQPPSIPKPVQPPPIPTTPDQFPHLNVPGSPQSSVTDTTPSIANPSAPANPSSTVVRGTPASTSIKGGTPASTTTATPTSTTPGTSTGSGATANPIATPRT